MFHVLERRFNIFGYPFWPQAFPLFVLSMLIGVIFIALFPVAFGRLFLHGWSIDDGDCNDNNDAIYPGATEQCDNTDWDCDGLWNTSSPIGTPPRLESGTAQKTAGGMKLSLTGSFPSKNLPR